MTIFFKLFFILSMLGGVDGPALSEKAAKSKKNEPRVCVVTRRADGTVRCVCQ
ncbi:MAG TPA: hypothetical protein VFS10_05475 [Pyrinomonadaceae bacterium]|nr:hypothetical protein [Pyrinomonadaceae bacterium]